MGDVSAGSIASKYVGVGEEMKIYQEKLHHEVNAHGVWFAWRPVRTAERRWVWLEKVYWSRACELQRFHQYCEGRNIYRVLEAASKSEWEAWT